ncbi:MAG: sulfurtransferase [Deltaproteobacteria bacterium]|nr:sulfurtransferase [Deltaproteobacteria bacterium]
MEQGVDHDRLVGPDWVEANLENPDIRIVEVGSMKYADAYYEGHIPGAVFWPWMESLWHPTSRQILSPEGFSRLMEKSGITHDTTIVLNSNQFQYTIFAFRICLVRGHGRTKMLHGKREDVWGKERPLTKEIPTFVPTTYVVRPSDESSRIGRQEILEGLDDPDRVLLDLRTPEEFLGERVSPVWFEFDYGAVRKGHIPGAMHLFYTELLKEDETFMPLKHIRETYEKVGATPDKEIVCYCRLSHRGTLGWFVAKYLLGYLRVRVYEGSWTEWGSLMDVPIVNETQE